MTSCGKSPPASESAGRQVVAEVGSRTILAGDLTDEASRRLEHRRPVPEKEALLAEMIKREALLQRARKAGLDRDPAYQREIESLLIRKLQAAELDPRRESVAIPDAAVKAEYETGAARFTRPAQARLAMLFLAADPKASETRRGEVRARLEEGRRKFLALSASASPVASLGFGPLAVDYSDDQVTRYRGGDLGWLEPGKHPSRVPAEVGEAAWALSPGKVSEVIEARNGFYLVLKADARASAVTPFESVQASLRQTLLVRKRNELEEQFHADTARLIPARVHTQALAAVQLPEAPATLAARNREPQPPALPGTNEPLHGH
jgi:parvulin-like peptidyl-prolyl isomerase